MSHKKTAHLDRVHRGSEIRHLRRTGRLSRGDYVYVWVARAAGVGTGGTSIGVVSSRGFRNAVQRNLAKRRVRSCLLDLRHELQEGNRYLVECRPGSEEADYQLLVNDVQGALNLGNKN